MGYRLGVDLGTTFTAAAYIEDAGPRMLELGNRNLTMPSVLFLTGEGRLLFGETAERRSSSEPERVLREFKRRIGDTVPIVVGEQTFDPSALQTELLRCVLRVADERLGGPPDHVVITHPANWGLFKIQLMRDIATNAGTPGATLCPEPVAAAVEYAAKQRVPAGAKVAVYDLGGGTFDVAVLEKTDDGFEIIGTPLGVDHLGGSDFDEAVLADAVSKLGLRGLDPDDPAVARGLSALRRECIEAKETLSSDVATDITSLLPGAGRPVRLTRAEFEGLIRPALDESIRTTVRALRMAGVDNEDLNAIVLVGGSSRIPLVTELLNREIAVPVAADTFPKHDIALGAARYATRLATPRGGPTSRTPTTTRPPSAAAGSVRATVSVTGESATPGQPELVPPTPTSNPPPADPSGTPTARTPTARTPTADAARTGDHGSAPHAPEILVSSPDGGPHRSIPGVRERPARKVPAGLIIAIVVVCLAIGTGIVIYRVRSSGSPGSQGSIVPSGQASTPVIDQEALGLPVGAPLPETQLIAPRYDKAGAPARLWLVDSADPATSTNLDAAQDGSARAIAMSTDRRTITYLDSGANAIRVMPAAGGTGRRLFASPDGCGTILHASWSPIDLTVFVVECQLAGRPARFTVVDVEGTIARELDTGQLHPADPTISPDGTTIAFSATNPDAGVEGASIFVMPIDGSAPPTQVTEGAVDTDPAWSPDGTLLAFGRVVGNPKAGDTDVLTVSPTGGTPHKVASGPAADGKATWSPDGHTIAFISDRDTDGSKADQYDIWLVPAGGGKPTPLGLESYGYATPTWWHR